MNTVHRIYGDRIQLILFSHDKTVGNLPQAVSQEDISKLFNKICPVTEVYVPGATPTGAFVQITLTAYILLLPTLVSSTFTFCMSLGMCATCIPSLFGTTNLIAMIICFPTSLA